MPVFLSYNRADASAVRAVREALLARGIETFVDWNDLTAGLSWPEKLENALRGAKAVAIFVGPSGLGSWQTREMYFALDLQVQAEGALPVMSVLLAGAEPPSGFLALNTWVDLRAGVSDASLAPLVRAIEGVVTARPVLDICPYRDLRAFREEDAALFFGRDESIAKLLQRLCEGKRLVAVVGTSGSGKSSVIMAGVLPELRRKRPPEVVWDYVTFTPDDAPWRRLADALMPLLEAELSEAKQLEEAATLANVLRGENGIASVIERVLQKSRGTDRLLVVVDQFEELFTLTEEKVAREFLAALLAVSPSVPLTLLLTLRSDYYGKAIALDRELSNALPDVQVNLGPIRRDELRDVIEKPAAIVGLSFETGLVDRILDDVGDEPGHLPLLEYALTELWKARSGDRMTFDAYEKIGRVAGALAKRANALYAELPDAQKPAARRLLMRCVRVSAADEEGADTRRRARRDEIDDEAWKLVPFFTAPRARLLVAGSDSGADTVEVAHEALIRKWDTLRAWIEEDRRFLLWRQQLAVYRAAWNAGDDATLLRGTLLAEAQKWLRTKRGELSEGERTYIETSASRVARSRTAWIAAAAVLLIALIAAGARYAWTHSGRVVVDRILAKGPEKYVVEKLRTEHIELVVRAGRRSQLEAAIDKMDERGVPLAHFASAVHAVSPQTNVKPLLDRAIREVHTQQVALDLIQVARICLSMNAVREAKALLRDAEAAVPPASEELFTMADLWVEAGEESEARRVVLGILETVPPEQRWANPELIGSCAARLAKYGDKKMAPATCRIGRREIQEGLAPSHFRSCGRRGAHRRTRLAACR